MLRKCSALSSVKVKPHFSLTAVKVLSVRTADVNSSEKCIKDATIDYSLDLSISRSVYKKSENEEQSRRRQTSRSVRHKEIQLTEI